MVPHWGVLDIELLREKRKPTYRPASLQKRFFNLLIDYLTIFHLAILVGFLIGVVLIFLGKNDLISGEQNFLKEDNVKMIFSLSIIFFYYFICESFFNGKTFGKYATQTIVKNRLGKKPMMQDIFLRSLLRFIPVDFISFLFGKTQGWHDTFSNTMVVDDLR